MDNIDTIKELQKQINDVEKHMEFVYRNIGYALLTKDSAAWISEFSKNDGQLSIEKFNSYDADKQRLQNDILEINNILKQISEVKERQTEAKKQITIQQGGWNECYEKLGEALYNNYSPDFASFFGACYTDLSVEKQKLAETERQVAGFDAERNGLAFFKKIVSNVKYTATLGTVGFIKNRIKSLYVKGGMAAWTSGVLKSDYENKLLKSEISDAFDMCNELNNDIELIHGQNTASSEHLKVLENQLLHLDSTGKGKVRIKELEKLIQEKQTEQDGHCYSIGKDFYFLFSNAKNESQISIPSSFSSEIKTNVCGMYRLNKQITSYRRRIDLIETEAASLRLEKQIESFSETIQIDKSCIEKLQNDINKLSERIVEIKKQKNEVDQKKAALEILERNFISLPDANHMASDAEISDSSAIQKTTIQETAKQEATMQETISEAVNPPAEKKTKRPRVKKS